MSNELNKLIETIATQLETDLRLGGPWLPIDTLDIKRSPVTMTMANQALGRGSVHKNPGQQHQSPLRQKQSSQVDHSAQTAQLTTLGETICACQLCPLHESRTQAVPGIGHGNAKIVFVGGAPNETEQGAGAPLVGPAGDLFDKIIAAMGLARTDVFLTNILKCHMGDSLKASPGMLTSCTPYLHQQLALIQPEIIVALGEDAAQYLLLSDVAIDKLRGRVHMVQSAVGGKSIKSIVIYHPNYLLENYTIEIRKRMWEDMQRVMTTIGMTPPQLH